MIVDLDKLLFVVDKKTHAHKVRFIDDVQKIVYVDGVENADGQAKITIEQVDGPYQCLSNIEEFQNLPAEKKQYYLSDEFAALTKIQQLDVLSQDVTDPENILMSIKYTHTDTIDVGLFYYSTNPLTVTIKER